MTSIKRIFWDNGCARHLTADGKSIARPVIYGGRRAPVTAPPADSAFSDLIIIALWLATVWRILETEAKRVPSVL
ncbi:hypothetical protein WJX75_006736 [Coccomyxa subellipsoidea]|uniref:Uncharacterized protein n=1 Tax=Coccomyxa subellipsoidea TaxID=248742 RepID=A0ABR2YXZ9_9CHLO